MLRYLETFFRHRLLLISPTVVLVALAIGWVAFQPPTYDATVRLWVQRQQLVVNPNTNPYVTPAQEQAAVITELLGTRYFCAKVGARSGLDQFLADPHGVRPSLPQQLLARLGLASDTAPSLSGHALDDAVYDQISKAVVLDAGPQIVTITFRGTEPVEAAKVAQAIADQFVEESLSSQRTQVSAEVDFYTGQVKDAQAQLVAADAALDEYLNAHSDQRTAVLPDARLTQLKRTDDDARQRVSALQSKLDEASLDMAALGRKDTSGIRVLDQAAPPAQNSIKRLLLEAGAVSLLLGLLVMAVGIMVLTLLDSTFRQPEEVEQFLDLRPVGSVPQLTS
jgi:polysaccharide biosynthesis transport protein